MIPSIGDRLVFPAPRDGDWAAHERAPYPIDEVAFNAADGVTLVSWHLRVERPRCTVLYFHGNGNNVTARLDMLLSLAKLDADVLALDYRGYGRSEGTPSEEGLYQDAKAAYDYLLAQGVPASRIVVFGESLGGGPAVDLASKHPCAGLILQSTFTSIHDVARARVPILPVHWLLKPNFDNLSKIASVAAPKLFIATKRDEVVPYAQTRRLFDTAAASKTWREFDNCGHNDLFWIHRREWAQAIGKFLDEVAP
ncbi:MAG: alpha/beta hydrolase [Planctomycetes bacterium]|nr:alpha/beta hydrolase [Planctomycetota bacterium]